jgi:O-antigen/teichoic acid export membrane protein
VTRDRDASVDSTATDRRRVGLGTTAVRAVATSSVGNVLGFALRFALTAVLARHLGPGTFGAFALAFSYSELLCIVGAFSFPQALVQLDDARGRLFGTVLWMTTASALALLVPAAVAAPFIRMRDGDAVGSTFLALVALRTLTGVAGCLECAMQRSYSYGRLATVRVVGIAASAVAAYAAMAHDWRLGALFLRDAVPPAVLLVLAGLAAWPANRRELFRIDRRTASEVWSLGRSLLIVRGLEIGFTRLDQLMVGLMLGTGELGLYSQAKYLATLPNAALAPATQAVGLRVMSGFRSSPIHLGRTYSMLQYGVARLTIAAVVACFVAPDLVIAVSLGRQWLGAADILRALSVWMLLLPLFEIEKALLSARRRWRAVYVAYVAKVAILAVGTWGFARLGGVGVALGATAALFSGWLLARASARREARAEECNHGPVLLAGAAGIAAGMIWRHASGGLSALAQAATGAAIAEFALIAALLLLERERLFAESRFVIRRLFDRGAGTRQDVDGA